VTSVPRSTPSGVPYSYPPESEPPTPESAAVPEASPPSPVEQPQPEEVAPETASAPVTQTDVGPSLQALPPPATAVTAAVQRHAEPVAALVPQQSPVQSARSRNGGASPAKVLEPLRKLAVWASANAAALVLSVGSLSVVLAVMAHHARAGKDRMRHL